MKKLAVFNLAKLVKITVFDKKYDDFYQHKNAIKLFRITLRKEGFYDKIWGRRTEIRDPELCIEGNVVYRKPRVHLYYQGEVSQTIVFDTIEEAMNYSRDIREKSAGRFNHIFE